MKDSLLSRNGRNYLAPFVLITSLFFLWGFAHSILDVLNKHFQVVLDIGKAQSALVQAAVYGGYFLMALPAGEIIRRRGYRFGVLTGLALYGFGALMFVPGSYLMSFPFFIASLFVIGCGLTCLETAANPYVTELGAPSAAERRINLAQSFNGLGWMVGPLVGGLLLFDGSDTGGNIALPYVIIGVAVWVVAGLFYRVELPEPAEAQPAAAADEPAAAGGLWSRPHFALGVVALLLYVAAQTGINSFFINFAEENSPLTARDASLVLSFGCMGLFLVGRMAGSWLMKYVRPVRLVLVLALGAMATMLGVTFVGGWAGLALFLLCYLCESVMFPTLFALSIAGLGQQTKRASSFLIMSIVGGAIAPVGMGLVADCFGCMQPAFFIPALCFFGIAAYCSAYGRLKRA